jgi:hypothetical protein
MSPPDDNLDDTLPGPVPTLVSWEDLDSLPFVSKLNLLDTTIATWNTFKTLAYSETYQKRMASTPRRKMLYWLVKSVARISVETMEALKEATYLRQELGELTVLVNLLDKEIKREKELGAKPLRMGQVLVFLCEKVDEVYQRWDFAIEMTQLRAVEGKRVYPFERKVDYLLGFGSF